MVLNSFNAIGGSLNFDGGSQGEGGVPDDAVWDEESQQYKKENFGGELRYVRSGVAWYEEIN